MLLGLCVAAATLSPAARAQTGSSEVSRTIQNIELVIDTSASMQGEKLHYAQQALLLATWTLPHTQRVRLHAFNATVETSSVYRLATAEQRHAPADFLARLKATGGTDYRAVLGRLSPRADAVLFITDGQPRQSSEEIMTFLRDHYRGGPLHTVAIAAPQAAQDLLARMAAATGGSCTSIEQPEQLVETLVKLALSWSDYRSYRPETDPVECRVAAGAQLVVFGFDADVAIDAERQLAARLLSQVVEFPQHTVEVCRFSVPSAGTVRLRAVQRRRPDGHLTAIWRNDLARATTSVLPQGPLVAGGSLHLRTEFLTPQGQPLDPRLESRIAVEHTLIGSDGQESPPVCARAADDCAALDALLPLPATTGPITVRTRSIDRRSGPPFETTREQAFVLGAPPPIAVRPTALVHQGAPGEFKLSLELEPAAALGDVTASLEPAPGPIELLAAQPGDDRLTLVFRGRTIGRHTATVLLTPKSGSPWPAVVARVPLDAEIQRQVQGLAVADGDPPCDLGAALATSGRHALGPVEVASLDQEPATYRVETIDLSCGQATLPLNSPDETLTIAAGKPAHVRLATELADVPAGPYTGSIQFRLRDDPQRRVWKRRVVFRVVEPLSITPVEIGPVAPGETRSVPFILEQGGNLPLDATCQVSPIDTALRARIVVPDSIRVPAGQSRHELTLRVLPSAAPQTACAAELFVHRAGGQALRIPVRWSVATDGPTAGGLLVAPERIVLQGAADQPCRFELRIKLAHGAGERAEVGAQWTGWQNEADQTVSISAGLSWPTGREVRAQQPLTVQGFIRLPTAPGHYRATLFVRSDRAGDIKIPIELTVL